MKDQRSINLFKASIITLLVLVTLGIVVSIFVGITFPFEDPELWPPKSKDAETEYYLPDAGLYIKSINKQGKSYIAFSSEPFNGTFQLSECPNYIQILRPYDPFTVYVDLCSHKFLMHHAPGVMETHFSSLEYKYLGAGAQVCDGILDADNEYILRPGYIGIEYDDPVNGALNIFDSQGKIAANCERKK